MKLSKTLFLPLTLLCTFVMAQNTQQINISPIEGDATFMVYNALKSASSKDVKIVLEEGVYNFTPTYAFEKYCTVTNHNNGLKKIIFNFEDFESVEIEGNGSILMCEGRLFPFLFENCDNVKVSGVTIDWHTPFLFYGEVVAVNQTLGYRDICPMADPDSWSIVDDKLLFPNSYGFNYELVGATLSFDPVTKSVVNGANDLNSYPTKVELLESGYVRFWERLKEYPKVGSTLNSKGDKKINRYAPAFDFKKCRNIELVDITIHHALGMGFLFERSENIHLQNSQIITPPNSDRVVSTTADATHFANCRGDILIEGCTFESMLDDGTNVHGTYVEVTDIIDRHTVNVSLHHYQQYGFKFAEAGDDMWFVMQPSPKRAYENRVVDVNVINETITTLKFEKPLPEALQSGDLIENKSWNPTFTMRNCTIRNHRARSIVLKTPLKTVIENNYFSSMMSAILFRGESYSWFESGQVKDVLIRNNYIENAAICGSTHAALYITPRLGKSYDSTELYDENIRFIDNTINNSNPRIVIADRVDGLIIKGNKIIQNNDIPAAQPNAPMFEFINCADVKIEDNKYKGKKPYKVLEIDDRSKESFSFGKNQNLSL